MLDEYQLIYCAKGSGIFHTESAGEMSVKAGDVMMLFPQERHTYHPDEQTGWKEYWIGFRGMNIDMRVKNGFFSTGHPLFHLPLSLSGDMIYLFSQGIKAAQHMERGYQQLLSGYVNMMLGYISHMTTLPVRPKRNWPRISIRPCCSYTITSRTTYGPRM